MVNLRQPPPAQDRSRDRFDRRREERHVLENRYRAREWKKNKWRNVHGEPKENSNLWNEFLSAWDKVGMPVAFEWQKGKTTKILANIDKAAKTAAKRGGLDADTGFRGGKVARSKVKESATRFPAQGQTAVIRVYRKTGKAENKIRFDLLDEVKKEYTASHYAFASDLLTIDLTRQGLFRVRFNNDPRYPQILEIIETLLLGRATPRVG